MLFKAKVDFYYKLIFIILNILFIGFIILSIIISKIEEDAFPIGIVIFLILFTLLLDGILLWPCFQYVKLFDDYLYVSTFMWHKKIRYDSIREIKTYHKLICNTITGATTSIDHTIIKYDNYNDIAFSIKEPDILEKEVINKMNRNI